jgi:hypothetical protein
MAGKTIVHEDSGYAWLRAGFDGEICAQRRNFEESTNSQSFGAVRSQNPASLQVSDKDEILLLAELMFFFDFLQETEASCAIYNH